MGTEDALVFTTGHQANLGTLGTILGVGRHRDRRLRRPRLDPRRLPALARQAAPLPPQPPGEAREDAPARRARRRRRAGGRRRRLLDGGRHRAAAGHLRAVRALRRTADGRRGPRRRRARRARRRHRRAARRGGPRRSAHGHLLEVAGLLRRLRGGARRGDRLPALSPRAPSCSPPPPCPPRVGAALAALRVLRSPDGAALLERGARERVAPARRPGGAGLRGRRPAAAAREPAASRQRRACAPTRAAPARS